MHLHQLSSRVAAPRRATVFSYTKKGLNIRPDSPKTREACLALGYDSSIFKLKYCDILLRKLEEFGGPDVTEAVQKMRFDHYVKKMEITFKEISLKRKQITKKNKGLQNIQLEKSFHRDEGLVNDLIETYNKKMVNLKINEEENADSYESFDEEDPVLVLEEQLEKEIRKYQRALGVKAKEVHHQLENEKKRHLLQQEMEEREKKIAELKERITKEKLLKKKKKSDAAQKKFNDIKNKEKQFNLKQIDERKRQLERFEELGRKLQFDDQIKKKEIEEHDKALRQKFETVKANKRKYDQFMEEKMTQTLSNLQVKQNECNSNKERFTWESKLEKLTMRSSHYDEKLRKIKLQTQQKEADTIQKVVEKMFNKDKDLQGILYHLHILALEKQKQMSEQAKVKEELTKRKKAQDTLNRIQSLQLQRVTNLEKKFLDQDQLSNRRKDEYDYQKNLRKEKLKIKQQDLIENYQRQERLKDLRFKQVIKDSQQLNEQKDLEKLSMELVRKAQQELQRKLKQENENLDRSLVSVNQADNKSMGYYF
ncbi:unnamed protein product (macronuclear) [Paramecium tetraurelia]|uniref:Trichohyalin-plectin-homology domain-containing protein n=1 Tax=Paramecium tetraurelia TaxID=5888 RepID=A0C3I7_PARTE|nr:uncharacterized protein GSPATT00034833001 [Paramecium tetraurelia]CAK65354.1 unnamed protein product [Paramecium tetraurelia]|eukprot:XP_001432751.1 hypothetical protein (macronuclear) [Paramecium tetraurelia strain d4-2]